MGKKKKEQLVVSEFEAYLFNQETSVSPITIRNYRADILQFISWYESVTKKSFHPSDIIPGHIAYYKHTTSLSERSMARHLSSLRKFLLYLHDCDLLGEEFTKAMTQKVDSEEATHIKAFTFYLFVQKASELTVKQYRLDVNHFLNWTKQVVGVSEPLALSSQTFFSCINQTMVENYMLYLKDEGFSHTTLNRKKSALHKYLVWLTTEPVQS